MPESSLQISSLTDLRDFVQKELCDQNELEVGAFRLTERVLEKSGAPCGMFYCLNGPRSVRLVAIWETSRNTVLFYSSTGERVQRVQLARAPSFAN